MGKGRDKRKRLKKKLRNAGLLPPKPDPKDPVSRTQAEDRDPRTRWTSVRTRGGGEVSLDFSGDTVTVEASAGDAQVRVERPKFSAPVDLDDAEAPSKVTSSALGLAFMEAEP